MTKPLFTLLASAGAMAAFALTPSAGLAQSSDRVSEIVVYGNDPCPRSTDDEVVVCARKPETERYRIPERLRTGGPRQTRDAWANKARAFETVGNTGINSCSPVGPGGHTGCLSQVINQARRERAEAEGEDTAPEE